MRTHHEDHQPGSAETPARLGALVAGRATRSFALPFCTWMLKGFFEAIPRELDEAALVDGCSRLRAFLSVILPISMPGIVATIVFAFLLAWNEFLFALVLTSKEQMFPVTVGIASFIGQFRISYESMMAAPVIGTRLAIDSVAVVATMISPRMYEQFILPNELELAEFYGGIAYWHSCANTTGLFPIIRDAFPSLGTMHVSPWADLDAAVRTFKGTDTVIEVCLHPTDSTLGTTPQAMEAEVRKIVDTYAKGGASSFYIRNDALNAVHGVDHDLAQIQRWISIARGITGPDGSDRSD